MTHVIAVDGSKGSELAFDFAASNTRPDDVFVVVAGRHQESAIVGSIKQTEIDNHERFNEIMGKFREKCLSAERKCIFESLRFNSVSNLASGINGIADRHNARDIFVGSRGFSATKSMMLGSVSSAVMHSSTRPVTVVKTTD